MVPYIGDLVGTVPIRAGAASLVSRAEVANTIRWRRAKGTAASIQGVARDVTGRDVVVVEFFQRLATTQHLDHIRPGIGTASLRDATAFLDPGGPFDAVPRNAELRAAAAGGRWGIPNVICFLWTWRAWQRALADPAPAGTLRFTFHPLGIDGPLLNEPLGETAAPGDPQGVATRLRRARPPGAGRRHRPLARGAGRRHGKAFHRVRPVRYRVGPHHQRLGAHARNRHRRRSAARPGSPLPPPLPARCRCRSGTPPSACSAAAAYPRGAGFDAALVPRLEVGVEVGAAAAYATLNAALAAPGLAGAGTIEVAGNGRLPAAGLPTVITAAAGRTLAIRAADGSWPVLQLAQTLLLEGGAGSEIVLDGFIIEGAGIAVPALVGTTQNGLQRLTLRHCTLVPGLGLTRAGAPVSPAALSVACASVNTVIVLESCITGPVGADAGGQLRISDCIIDAGAATATAIGGSSNRAAPGVALWIYNSTVRGGISTTALALASNLLCLGAVAAQQRQNGISCGSAIWDRAMSARGNMAASPPPRRPCSAPGRSARWTMRGSRPPARRQSWPGPTMAARSGRITAHSIRRARTDCGCDWVNLRRSGVRAG